MSSPFFQDLLSLPQPPDGEHVEGLPVVQLPEDSGVLNSLISLLYPITPIIPDSYEKVFALLGACQKYDMTSIQSYVRSEVKRGTFSAPAGAEAFRAYAIASSMGLLPEMESAARFTLGYPMTFEFLGEGLRSFEGWALCDLARYRKRCRDNLVSCLDKFFDVRSRFQIWAGCREQTPNSSSINVQDAPTVWLQNFFWSKKVALLNDFTGTISSPSTILEEYLAALKNHNSSHCPSCCRVHVMEGVTFCRELGDQLTQALDKVTQRSVPFWIVKLTDLNLLVRGIGIVHQGPAAALTAPEAKVSGDLDIVSERGRQQLLKEYTTSNTNVVET